MPKLYDDLINIIDFVPDKDEELKTEKYFKTLEAIGNFYTNFIPLMVLFVLFLYWFGGVGGCLLYVVFLIVCITIYKRYKSSNKARMERIMAGCDLNKMLTEFIVMARFVRGTKGAESLLPSISYVLYYMGKFDEAKKVINLVCKHCNTLVGNAHRLFLYTIIARREMDKESEEQYIRELEKLMTQVNTPVLIKAYENICKYPLIMEAEENGDYSKALELMEEYENENLLAKVSRNYGLYKIAKNAGLEAETSKHRAFVLEHGGDTFYKRELEGVG